MMRSMFSGVSGLKVHQTKMDVIGNNIANVNTVGYKSQRVTFSDVFSQTISASSSANDETGRGGVNVMQVGLGVNVSSIDMLMTQGAAQRTDNPFDVMINGDGFIVVGDATGQYFTRAGTLRLDAEGNLVISNGMKVQGWNGPAIKNDKTGDYEIPRGQVDTINLGSGENKSIAPTATQKIDLTGNLCTTDSEIETSVSFYDSLGNVYSMPIILTNTQGSWKIDVKETQVYDDQNVVSSKQVVTDQNGNMYEVSGVDFTKGTIDFDENGTVKKDNNNKIEDITFSVTISAGVKKAEKDDIPAMPTSTVATDKQDFAMNISTLTQYAIKSSINSKSDGNAAGDLSGYSIDSNGIITATYSNGDIKKIAQIPLAQFDNPTGLEKVGDNVYAMTTNSGQFDGIGSTGVFNTGVLEMSNVDLSSEFTDMIVTQRGFQANSRIISVSDEMLQELTNLKR